MLIAACLLLLGLGDNGLLDQPVPAAVRARTASPLDYTISEKRGMGSSDKRMPTVSYGGHDVTLVEWRDSRNYVGYFIRKMGARDYPLSEPTALAVIDGRARELGPGQPSKVWSLDHFLVSIPVDERNIPSGTEFTVDSFLRVYRGKAHHDIGRWTYVGSLGPSSLVLQRNRQVAFWKNGRFTRVFELAGDWKAVAVNKIGDVLLRPQEKDQEVPGTYEEARAGTTGEEEDERSNWSAAVLSNGVVRQLRFAKPANTKDLLWDETIDFSAAGRVRFSAFYGDVAKQFELGPRK
ncbi:MAG: hypothetical protein ACAH95_16970 [Fimbriimonas sp.]